MTQFKLYKVNNNIYHIVVHNRVIEVIQNNLLSESEAINLARNSISSYSNFSPFLKVMF